MSHRPLTASSSRRFQFTSRTSIVVITLLVLVTAAIGARAWLSPFATTRYQQAAATPTVTPTGKPKPTPNPSYVRRSLVSPQLMPALSALGTRLLKAGQERVTLLGTISRPQQSKSVTSVRLISEFPDLLRLEEQDGSVLRVTLVNETGASKLGAPLATQDQDEVESLLLDSADHFFAGQMKGLAMRGLGNFFRLDNGKAANYTGPYYDIYQMYDQVKLSQALRNQPKNYYFNFQTQLIERVRYELARNGTKIKVETQLSGWKAVNNQQLPGTITRLENGKPTLVLNISSAFISPHAADGIFTHP